MPNYQRWHLAGETYFFTVVAHERRPIFTRPAGLIALRQAFRIVRRRFPFELNAIVVLPDHLHAICTLPLCDGDYSTRWSRIKREFTDRFLAAGESEGRVSASRMKRQERGVWQRRFWEHLCRSSEDLEAHFNYLHWNPVKHGLTPSPWEWRRSSFRRYVRLGWYAPTWASSDPCPRLRPPE